MKVFLKSSFTPANEIEDANQRTFDLPDNDILRRGIGGVEFGLFCHSAFYQVVVNGVADQLRIAPHLHFFEDAGTVGADRLDA